MRELPLDLIRPDPDNVRKGGLGDLPGLASSIEQWGLLQNLVVREDGDGFVIVAGERRWRAMKILQAEQRTIYKMQSPWYEHIPCMLIDTDGVFEQLIENILREDVPVWHTGHKYLALMDGGYTQGMLAEKLNKSIAHVSICCRIAKYLCPAVIRGLDKLGPNALRTNQLLRISRLYNPLTFEPDEKAQHHAMEQMLMDRKVKKGPRNLVPERERVWIRYNKLKLGYIVPAHAQSYVDALMRYLQGKDLKLTFR